MSRRLAAARLRLASVDAAPDRAVRWFASAGYAVLPLGVAWSAVCVRGRRGIEAWVRVSGPAFHDSGAQAVYFLVPPETVWCPYRDGELLTAGQWLSVPDPSRAEPPGSYWLLPPGGELVDPGALQHALARVSPEAVG